MSTSLDNLTRTIARCFDVGTKLAHRPYRLSIVPLYTIALRVAYGLVADGLIDLEQCGDDLPDRITDDTELPENADAVAAAFFLAVVTGIEEAESAVWRCLNTDMHGYCMIVRLLHWILPHKSDQGA